ncbi:MAG: hypothetical protein P1P84_07590 [Deferrisomatales bacterium]|nr:hypothetical protein [Deferrisomatales bacterium]
MARQRTVLLFVVLMFWVNGVRGAEAGPPVKARDPVEVPSGASSPQPTLPSGVKSLVYRGGLLTLDAENASLLEVLRAISSLTGIPIEPQAGVGGGVAVTIDAAPLQEALLQIVRAAGEENYALEFVGGDESGEPSRVDRVAVLRRGNRVPPLEVASPELSAEVAERLRAREVEYRALFAEMAKRKSPIGEAITEYKAPGTSDKRRTKLKTFFRQTPVRDPKDKALLKAAIFDPKNRVLINELEMALLHAIQNNPEEGDKEYLLHLFTRPDIGVGWLVYAIPRVWDERYVPHLIHYANLGAGEAIEILGQMKVTEAVPVLEALLRAGDGLTPRNAANALFLITGHKYTY